MSPRVCRAVLAAALLVPTGAFAGAPEGLNLKPGKDTHILADATNKITFGPVTRCLQHQKTQSMAAERTCLCENRASVQAQLKRVDAVIHRHPAWRHRRLHFKDGDASYDMTLDRVMAMHRLLAHCRAAPEKGHAGAKKK